MPPTPADLAAVPGHAVAAVAAALLLGVVVAVATPVVLRRLPEPTTPDAAGKLPYAALATPRVAAGLGLVACACGVLAFGTLTWPHWPAWVALAGVNVIACGVDARTTWLPLALARAGWAVAAAGAVVVAAATGSWTPLLAAAGGAAALGAFFHLVWRVSGAFGYGDVRLAATIGAVTALDSVSLVGWSVLLGTAAGAVLGVVHRLRDGPGGFPYGPGLLAGPFLALALRAAVG